MNFDLELSRSLSYLKSCKIEVELPKPKKVQQREALLTAILPPGKVMKLRQIVINGIERLDYEEGKLIYKINILAKQGHIERLSHGHYVRWQEF